MILVDAIDTIFTLGWALLAWLVVFALLLTALLLGVAALICWARGRIRARRTAGGPSAYEEVA